MSQEKKADPIPRSCVCGSNGILVTFRGKKMMSCPNPERCVANLRTERKSNKNQAIAQWNALVDSFVYTRG